jgi:hypothetical protein
MAFAHYWQYIRNSEGQPINGVNISVYEAGTNTPVYVYDAESGGTATNTAPQVTSDANGFFEFWIADHYETNGYASNIKFKIAWDLPGVITADNIDNVDIIIPLNKAGKFTGTISTTNLVPDDGLYSYTVTHNLDYSYPVVAAYQIVGSNTQTIAVTAAMVDDNNTKIYVENDLETKITLIG